MWIIRHFLPNSLRTHARAEIHTAACFRNDEDDKRDAREIDARVFREENDRRRRDECSSRKQKSGETASSSFANGKIFRSETVVVVEVLRGFERR